MSETSPDKSAENFPSRADAGGAALARAELEEAMEELRSVRKRKSRYALWAFLGISPAAVLPAVGLLLEGSLGLVILLGFLVTVTQFIGWLKSAKREEELEDRLRRLIGED